MLVNLCPHAINLHKADGTHLRIPPEVKSARVTSTSEFVGEVDGYPVHRTVFGPVEGLPDPQHGVYYIVSALVLNSPSVADRHDLLAPGTGPNDNTIRDDTGRIMGITRLISR